MLVKAMQPNRYTHNGQGEYETDVPNLTETMFLRPWHSAGIQIEVN